MLYVSDIMYYLQVRISMYKNDRPVAWVEFDGLGSDNDNWMSNNRIMKSTFSDIHIQKRFCQVK